MMTAIAPASALKPFRWNRESILQQESWKFTAPAGIAADAEALQQWAATVENPVAELTRLSLDLPAVRELAEAIGREIDYGTGVAVVRGVPPYDEQTRRLLYLAIGLELGTPLETYGRLYNIADYGSSYRDNPIPVSQTHKSTGMHTDSSGVDVCPRVLCLLCLRQAPKGGVSHVAWAAEVHERLRAASPELLERLYQPFARDVVTPGSDRSPKAVARNSFPVFAWRGRLVTRYMRYWIEKGQERVGRPLSQEDLTALDILDRELNDERNKLSFTMQPGEMLFIDNMTTVHDRDEYYDDPAAPRLLVRQWIDRPMPPERQQ